MEIGAASVLNSISAPQQELDLSLLSRFMRMAPNAVIKAVMAATVAGSMVISLRSAKMICYQF